MSHFPKYHWWQELLQQPVSVHLLSSWTFLFINYIVPSLFLRSIHNDIQSSLALRSSLSFSSQDFRILYLQHPYELHLP